jgi:hypothetical protein
MSQSTFHRPIIGQTWKPQNAKQIPGGGLGDGMQESKDQKAMNTNQGIRQLHGNMNHTQPSNQISHMLITQRTKAKIQPVANLELKEQAHDPEEKERSQIQRRSKSINLAYITRLQHKTKQGKKEKLIPANCRKLANPNGAGTKST